MQTHNSLDKFDQNLLRILSVYDQLAPLQLWFEMGEDDAVKETVSEEEIRKRLESLAARGYVEKVVTQDSEAGSASPIYHARVGGDTDGAGET